MFRRKKNNNNKDESIMPKLNTTNLSLHEETNPIIDFMQSVIIALVISIVLYLFVLTPSQVDGNSMDPNFQHGQRVFTNRLPQWLNGASFSNKLDLDYQRGDVIVFQKPGAANPLIKRVIGMPNETIAIRDGHYYINGNKLEEDYIDYSKYPTKGGSFIDEDKDPVTIPEGFYFVSGDNRPVSNDSRYVQIGFINREWIKGKVIFSLWPLDNFGIIHAGEYELE
jgi:signal peptidase I